MTHADQPAQTDVFPTHTHYQGELPISVEEWVAGHPDRRLEILPIAQPSPSGDRLCAILYSEHGWPLSTHRRSGMTEGEVRRKLREHPIHYVQPRVSPDGTRWQ